MTRFSKWLGAGLVSLAVFACSNGTVESEEPVDVDVGAVTFATCGNNCSSWIYPSAYAGNHLIYVPDDEGDRIPDFSHIGYNKSRGGTLNETMPRLGTALVYNKTPPRQTASSTFCADAPRHDIEIQQYLDIMGACLTPDASGMCGRLTLPRGHYSLKATLVVPERVVLEGVSEEPDAQGHPATTLHACATGGSDYYDDALVVIDDLNGDFGVRGASYNIQDEVVPVGSTNVTVPLPSPTAIQRGNRILITRKTTPQWLADLGQTDTWTEPHSSTSPCQKATCFRGDIEFERTVTHVEGVPGQPGSYRVFFEHGLTNALELRYGPHTLQVFTSAPERANFAGVYRLRGNGVDGSAEHFVVVEKAIDSWVKNVVAEAGFSGSAVTVNSTSRQITVEDATSLAPGGEITGGLRYSFQMRGHMNLIVNARADHGRHDFLARGSSTGPNAFVDCTSTNTHNDAASHDDWSLGTLFDRVWLQKCTPPGKDCGERAGKFTAENNHVSDLVNTDSHGWTGANLVVWNSISAGYKYFNPPTAQNWLIGSVGEPRDEPNTNERTDPDEAYALGESPPHYDFREPSEHGTRVSLAPLSTAPTPSLFRTANAQWRTGYLANGKELEVRHYFIGDPDQPTYGEIGDGTAGDVNDPVYVNSGFLHRVRTSFFGPNVQTANFDVMVTDHAVPFTVRYQLEPGETIVGAYLAARIERGTWGSDADHRVLLAGRDYDNQRTEYYWRCNAPCLSIPATMTGPEGWPTSVTQPMVKILDLTGSFLPYLNNTLNSWGELNVAFYKRTRVDWAALTLLVQR